MADTRKPWTSDARPIQQAAREIVAHYGHIDVWVPRHGIFRDPVDSVSRLIASAPDLYDAVLMLLGTPRLLDLPENLSPADRDAIEFARAAIIKATGAVR